MQRIKYVQRQVAGGVTYLYFRKGAHREGPLLNPEGSEALRQEVDAILQRLARAERAAARPRPGHIGGLLDAYNRSAEFLALARSTQADYQRRIDELKADFGALTAGEITPATLRQLRDAWAPRGYRLTALNMQVLANACAPAIDDGLIEGDPFARVRLPGRPHDAGEPHPAWTDQEVAIAIEDAVARKTPGLARAIALGRWGGFRRGTICAIPLSVRLKAEDAHGRPERRLYWRTEKRGVICDKREDQRLTELLRQTPDQALLLAYNADGGPWKERQLSQAIDRHMARLAKAGAVRAETAVRMVAGEEKEEVYSPLTLHGLRHARGLELAEAGASDAEIMSQLEHATPSTARIYRRQAERKRLADSAQDRIDNVLTLRTAREQRRAQGDATVKPTVKKL